MDGLFIENTRNAQESVQVRCSANAGTRQNGFVVKTEQRKT